MPANLGRSYRVVTGVAVLALFIVMLAGEGTEAGDNGKPSMEGGYIDVHEHLTMRADFRPSSGRQVELGGRRPGRGSGDQLALDLEGAAVNLISFMDRSKVAMTLLMPPPTDSLDKARPTLAVYEAIKGIVRKHPDRFSLVGGGHILNPLIHENSPSIVTTILRERFEKEAEKLVKDGIKAFGEMTALHLSLGAEHPFEETQPDHPLFLLLADIAARHDIPVDLHMEAVPHDMPTPEGLRKRSPLNPPALKENIQALERLLQHNRGARIVWQHIGWDNTGGMTIETLRGLLERHPNLFLAVLHRGRSPSANPVMDGEWHLRPQWRQFFSDYPDRFVIGTDRFFAPKESPDHAPGHFEHIWAMLDELPENLRAKIGSENAARIYKLK